MSTCTSNGLLRKVYIHGLLQQLVPFIFRGTLNQFPAAGILVEVEMPERRRDGDQELKVPARQRDGELELEVPARQ
jgi:hypothetical protein